jgi:ribosome-associated translation inhibitor RaiA
MNVRLSGLNDLRDAHGQQLSVLVSGLPSQVLSRFESRLESVALHVGDVDAGVARSSRCRVEVECRDGTRLNASATAADPVSAARRALSRVRRLLRRAAGREMSSQRVRVTPV